MFRNLLEIYIGIFILLAELPFTGIEIAAPDLNIGVSLCTLVKMCYAVT